MNKIYALYKGEELLHDGTLAEIVEAEKVKVKTIQFYMTPTYRKRRENSKTNNFREVVRLDE